MITVSLPPAMAAKSAKFARKQNMTRSELFRTALRNYLEEVQLDEAIRIAEEEFRTGKAKLLPKGGLVALMRKK